MNVHEYQAAEILARYGVPVNPGRVAETPDEAAAIAADFGGTVAIKAQVHTGGRGKAGGIKLAHSKEEAREAAAAILGMDISGHTVNKVLVAKGVRIAQEFYLGVVLDRAVKKPVLMVSSEGGVEIEKVAAETPEKIFKAHFDPAVGLQSYQVRTLCWRLGISGPTVP